MAWCGNVPLKTAIPAKGCAIFLSCRRLRLRILFAASTSLPGATQVNRSAHMQVRHFFSVVTMIRWGTISRAATHGDRSDRSYHLESRRDVCAGNPGKARTSPPAFVLHRILVGQYAAYSRYAVPAPRRQVFQDRGSPIAWYPPTLERKSLMDGRWVSGNVIARPDLGRHLAQYIRRP